MQGRKQFQEKLFTSFQLSDRVPSDNLYRRLLSSVDFNFLYKQTARYYGTEGQESIDPIVFFKLMLVGYLENLGSDRRIIHTSSMRLDILYFIGYDIDESLPWHSTLSRTRQLYGEEVFRELFKRILKQCIDKGMVAGRRQAVDSVHVKANASMDSITEKAVLDDVDAFTKELTESQEDNVKTVSTEKKNKVDQHHRWKTKAYHGQPGSRSKYLMDQNATDTNSDRNDEEEMRAKFLSNHTHYSTTDPDARIAVKPGKPRQFNYLGQTSVDTAHHVITHIHADYADKKDSQCLARVIKEVNENFQSTGLVIEQILADTGYSSGEALKALEQNNITGYIPNFGKYKPEREGFTYHKEEDYYSCPQNKKILFKKIKSNNGHLAREYRSTRKDCGPCPLRAKCIGKSPEKKIVDTVDKPYYDTMHLRLQSRYARSMKKLRQSTVEPVLGTLVNFLGMKRVNTRGIKLANKCLLMAAVAYNLKKMLKFKTKKIGTIAMEVEHLIEGSFTFLMNFRRNLHQKLTKISSNQNFSFGQ